jgi:hypothetical protein
VSLVLDSSGNENHGTPEDNPVIVTGKIDNALSFDGDNSRVEIPAGAFESISNEITIAPWVACRNQPKNGYLFEAVVAARDRAASVHLPWGNNNVYWDAGTTGTLSFDRVFSSTSFTSEEWTAWRHWVFTKNTTTEMMRIYLDGRDFVHTTGNTKSMAGVTHFNIGNHAGDLVSRNTHVDGQDGSIDDFRIYDVELSEAEIAALYLEWKEGAMD